VDVAPLQCDQLADPHPRRRGASFQVLPAVPKRLEGLDFTLAILDEFGRMEREVYEVVVGASGKRPTSTAIGIGTPPPDPAEFGADYDPRLCD
jgi:phage terminase large subunit-like protein